MSTYSFDVEDAVKYGANQAIILFNLRFWCAKNEANERHQYDGKTWTYNSVKAFCVLFPWMSKGQVARALTGLEEAGAITTGNFNKSNYDRTRWYSVVDQSAVENAVIESAETISRDSEIDFPELGNGIAVTGEPIPDSKHRSLNSYSKPDGKQETLPAKAALPKDHDLIFNHWVQVMGKGDATKPTPGRMNKIKARLKEGYSVDDIKLAIDGCRQDPFSMGQNDRSKPYNDIELICRTGEKLESFITSTAKLDIGPVISAKDRERAEIIKARNEAMGIGRPRDNKPFIDGDRL